MFFLPLDILFLAKILEILQLGEQLSKMEIFYIFLKSDYPEHICILFFIKCPPNCFIGGWNTPSLQLLIVQKTCRSRVNCSIVSALHDSIAISVLSSDCFSSFFNYVFNFNESQAACMKWDEIITITPQWIISWATEKPGFYATDINCS